MILIISCASKKVTKSEFRQENYRQEIRVDSAQTLHVVKEIKQQAVPADTATTKITISAIEDLPAGAKFTAKSGRAGVELRRTAGDTIVITAICDSLQLLVYYYEKELLIANYTISKYEDELKITQKEKSKKNDHTYLAYFFGLSSGLLIMFVVMNKKSLFEKILNIIKKLFK